tara:strand:+ start:215 stop:373 length:159 start_codon:yes stop_codon:yes gene_type:complete
MEEGRKKEIQSFSRNLKKMIDSHSTIEHYFRSRRKKEGTIVPKNTNVIKGGY